MSTDSHPYVWINYYKPQHGQCPTAYKFGDGTESGYADIWAKKLILGGKEEFDVMAEIHGDTAITGNCYANNFYNNSTRNIKKNIQPQKADALSLIKLLKFYSYDYDVDLARSTDDTATEQSHINFGLVAEESPQEIKSEDGKAINLYEFISLTAKSVQELNEKSEAQTEKIKTLEEKIKKLENMISDLK